MRILPSLLASGFSPKVQAPCVDGRTRCFVSGTNRLVETLSSLRAEEKPQATDDPGDAQVIVVMGCEPPPRVTIEQKHSFRRSLERSDSLLVVSDRLNLGLSQDRRLGLGGAAGRKGKQPLNIVMYLLQLLVGEAEHIHCETPASVTSGAGKISMERPGCP